VTDPFPNRPKGMRWATYNRLKAKADELELKGDPEGLIRAEKVAASRLDESLAALLKDPKARARMLKHCKLPGENANH
jgi:hypothetical protein